MRACRFVSPEKNGIVLWGAVPRSRVSTSHNVTKRSRPAKAGVKIKSITQAINRVAAASAPNST